MRDHRKREEVSIKGYIRHIFVLSDYDYTAAFVITWSLIIVIAACGLCGFDDYIEIVGSDGELPYLLALVLFFPAVSFEILRSTNSYRVLNNAVPLLIVPDVAVKVLCITLCLAGIWSFYLLIAGLGIWNLYDSAESVFLFSSITISLAIKEASISGTETILEAHWSNILVVNMFAKGVQKDWDKAFYSSKLSMNDFIKTERAIELQHKHAELVEAARGLRHRIPRLIMQ